MNVLIMQRVENIRKHPLYCSLMEKISDHEQNRKFCCHGMEHSLDVARIAYIINLEESLGIDKELIYAAALLHDIGRGDIDKKYGEHHESGCILSRKILQDAGFAETEICVIIEAISLHNSERDKRKGLEYLLYRGDKLSRCCFSCKAYADCYWKEENKNKYIHY